MFSVVFYMGDFRGTWEVGICDQQNGSVALRSQVKSQSMLFGVLRVFPGS